jgi:restriction system protein
MKEFTLHLLSVQHDSKGFQAGFSYKDESYLSSIDEIYNSYKITLTHTGLGLSKTVKDTSLSILTAKAQAIINKWAAEWNKNYTTGTLSKSIKEKNEELNNILNHTLNFDDKIDFDQLKNTTPFENTITYEEMLANLHKIIYPKKPENPILPQKPEFIPPKVSILDKLLGKTKVINEKAKMNYVDSVSSWQKEVVEIQDRYDFDLTTFSKKIEEIDTAINNIKKELSNAKDRYEKEILESNIQIEVLKESYKNNEPNAIQEYCEIVLNNSSYPDFFPKEFEIEYNHDNQLLIINYTLPSPDQIPKEKDVKFNLSKNESTNIYFSEKEFASRYNTIVYMILLRTIHEIFESDIINSIDYVCINGLINHLNKATGNYEYKCIASVSADKAEFNQYNLENIDPVGFPIIRPVSFRVNT